MHANRVGRLVPAYNDPVWPYSHDHIHRRDTMIREVGAQNAVREKKTFSATGGVWGKFPVRRKILVHFSKLGRNSCQH